MKHSHANVFIIYKSPNLSQIQLKADGWEAWFHCSVKYI